ncbi:MAG: CHAT domain-containing protein, partial [Methanotrichaceae archaeon]|nr:CHAT domain-containing protein [Methanotrichaceae archaeon]
AAAYSNRIRGDKAENIERAINHYQEALKIRTLETFPVEWAMTQNNLAAAYSNRIKGDKAENIERAINHYQEALKIYTLEAFPVEWAMTQNNLAAAYSNRIRGDRADNIDLAINHYQEALKKYSPMAHPHRSRSAAGRLGRLLIQLQRWSEAANAFDLAMDATTNLYRGSVSNTSREGELREAGDVYHLAAYSLARSGQFKDAVVALERGRARGLAESLARNRADMERLKEMYAEAHDLFMRAVELRQAVEQEDRAAMGSSEPGEEISARRLEMAEKAGAMMEKALERIWQVPGYEDFLKDPGWEVVSRAASDGQALVYLCASPLGGLALIWNNGGEEVREVKLDLDDKDLRGLLEGPDGNGGWLGAYSRWKKAYLQSQDEWLAAQNVWMAATLEIGSELWQRVMGPVIEALRSQNARQAVLIPCGLMGLLPLHAAWRDEGGRHRYALEEMAISYAPSARALAHARNGDATSRPKRLMAVDEPATKGVGPLPNSHKEVEAISAHFEEKVILEHEQATLDSVLEALPGSEVAHFSCHGKVEWDDPYKSGLFLAGEDRLSVEEISRLRLEGARLAVLSACETGVIGGPLPDEVISLPGALMGAGFSGVVSTLWSVSDKSSALLMDRFYQLWLGKGRSPAEALRAAQMEMMEKGEFQHPVHWAAFYMSGV